MAMTKVKNTVAWVSDDSKLGLKHIEAPFCMFEENFMVLRKESALGISMQVDNFHKSCPLSINSICEQIVAVIRSYIYDKLHSCSNICEHIED